MKVPRIAVTFDGRQIGLGVVKNVADLRQEAESAFKLQEGSYDIYDKRGKVEGDALDRVLGSTAANCTCELEVRERPEWRKMRELESRIEALAASKTSVESMKVSERMEWCKMRQLEARVEAISSTAITAALQHTEEHILGKVQAMVSDAFADLRHVESKVDDVLAPLVQNLAVAQMDCQAELQSFHKGLTDCETLLLEELKRFDGSALAAQVDKLEERMAATDALLAEREALGREQQADNDCEATQDYGCSWGWSTSNEEPEKPALAAPPSAVELDLGPELEVLSPKARSKSHKSKEQDAAREVAKMSPGKSKMSPGKCHVRVDMDGEIQFSEGGLKGELALGRPGKSRRHKMDFDDVEWGGLAAPFARAAGAKHQLGRRPLSQSVPVLPPVF